MHNNAIGTFNCCVVTDIWRTCDFCESHSSLQCQTAKWWPCKDCI